MTQLDSSSPDPLAGLVKRRRRRSRSKFKKFTQRVTKILNPRTTLITLIALVLIVVVVLVGLATDANNRVRASASNLTRLTTSIQNKPGTNLTLTDFDRLQAGVNDLSRNLNIARRQTLILRPFKWVYADLGTSLDGLDTSQELALAANDMLLGLEPTLFFMVEGDEAENIAVQISSGQRIVELLRLGRARFVSAQAHLDAAKITIDDMNLDDISSQLLLEVDTLSGYYQQLQDINNLLLNAPDLLTTALGLDETRTYLILSQNSDELRPSGGYISTYGWVRIQDGRVIDYQYYPTTTTTPNPPQIETQFHIPAWWVQYQQPIYAAWDGSWYADFPSTADMAQWYYNGGSNPHAPVDGVIAIDIFAFEYLLNALGDIAVPGYETIVTADNFRQVVYDIRAFGGEERPHKEFIAALYQQIFSNWQTVRYDSNTHEAILGATLQALQEKHMMFYFTDAELNQAVEVLDWAGKQDAATQNDYLMVVDANLGNKSNRSITRQITYDVEIQPDGTLSNRATIAYDYPAFIADNDPAVNPEYNGPIDYNNLLQVFIPQGSTFTDNSNFQSPVQQVNTETHTLLVGRVAVAYDEGERFQLAYTTPPLVETFGSHRRYRLLLQKQAGTPTDIVSVQISLPPGTQVISTTPQVDASFDIDRPILEFRIERTSDQWIEVIYRE